jgi:cytochrome c peroxidase
MSVRPFSHLTTILTAALAVTGLVACSQKEDAQQQQHHAPAAPSSSSASKPAAGGTGSTTEDDINPRLLRRFQPLAVTRAEGAPPAELVDLGRALYFDTRLSRDKSLSCNSCHSLDQYGVDNHKTSTGFNGKLGTRNSPSVYNAAGHFAQFWDGRAADVEAQAKGPILNPDEMAMPDAKAVVTTLKAIPGYASLFSRAFPNQTADAVTYDNVGVAIGAFERGLMTPGRWDDFLRGNKDALNAEERKGLKTFLNSGCMVCHTGAYLGGSMFERVGVVEPWPNQADQGRQGVTKSAADKMLFKVPSLRNVEKTAPYFHDGSAATLEDAVKMMGKHQLGLELSADETASIVTWLKSLTGPLPPASYINKPAMP